MLNCLKKLFRKSKKVECLEKGKSENGSFAVPVSYMRPKRSNKDEDLSFNFSIKYAATIKKQEDIICDAVKSNDIETLIQSMIAFDDFYSFCLKHGKGGKIYFEDMWLHCFNSKNPCFSFKKVLGKNLNRLYKKYTEIPQENIVSFLYYNSLKVKDLKDILKDNNLKLSGTKLELMNRLIDNNVPVTMNKDEQLLFSQQEHEVKKNKDFIRNNAEILNFYLRNSIVRKDQYFSTAEALKKSWGFAPSINDALWGALSTMKLEAMGAGDWFLYNYILEDQIELLISEGRYVEAERIKNQLIEIR